MSDSNSFGSSSSSNSSFIPNYPQADFLTQLAQLTQQLGQQQYQWAQNQFAKTSQVTDQAVGNFLNASQMSQGLAQNNIDRYEGMFQPLENQLVDDANSYSSDARVRSEMGAAESDVGQSFDSSRKNLEQQLSSFGIDPSSGRYAELERANDTARAAAQAGAGQAARYNTENTGRQLRGQAIAVGQQYPGQVVNALNASNNSLAGAENASLSNANTGANMFNSARGFLDTASGLKYPPLGNQGGSSSNQRSSSSRPSPQQSGGSGNGGGGKTPQAGDGTFAGSSNGNPGQVTPASTAFGNPGSHIINTGGNGDGFSDGYQGIYNDPMGSGAYNNQSTDPWGFGGNQTDPTAGWGAAGDLSPMGNEQAFGINGPDMWDNYSDPTQGWAGSNMNPTDNFSGSADPFGGSGSYDGGQAFDNYDSSGGGNSYDAQYNDSSFDFADGGAVDPMQDGIVSGGDPWQAMMEQWGIQFPGSNGGMPQAGTYAGPGSQFQPPGPAQQQSSMPSQPSQPSAGAFDGYAGYGTAQSSQPGYMNIETGPMTTTPGGPPDPMMGNPVTTTGGAGLSGGNMTAGYGMSFAGGGAIPDDPNATTGGFVSPQLSPSQGQQTDDIPARLNANEFVIPRDVALWKGQEFFQKLIDQSRKARGGAPAQGKPSQAPMAPPRFRSQGAGR